MPEKPLTAEEKQMCKDIFKALDQDNDGQITHADFKKALEKAGVKDIKDAEVKKYIAMADKDNSGAVSLDEFMKVCETRPLKRRVLQEMFKELDTDNSGTIDAKDIKTVLKKSGYTYTDEEVAQIVKLADKSGDGKIDFAEFEAAMNKLLEEA